EPLLRKGAQRYLVSRNLEENGRLRPAMREQVNEVENERIYAIVRERARNASLQLQRILRVGNLRIPHGQVATQLANVCREQFVLVRIERFVVAVLPQVRESCGNLTREQAAEQRVARVGSGCGQNGEVMSRLHLEPRGK